MQIRIFNIPLVDNDELQSELNQFLLDHDVLEVEQHFFKNDKGIFWSFCVRYLPFSSAPLNSGKEKKEVVKFEEEKYLLADLTAGVYNAPGWL